MVRRIARVAIGLPRQLEAAAAEPVLARSGFDQLGDELVSMAPQKAQLVLLRAVQRDHQHDAMVAVVGCLVESERFIVAPGLAGALRAAMKQKSLGLLTNCST